MRMMIPTKSAKTLIKYIEAGEDIFDKECESLIEGEYEGVEEVDAEDDDGYETDYDGNPTSCYYSFEFKYKGKTIVLDVNDYGWSKDYSIYIKPFVQRDDFCVAMNELIRNFPLKGMSRPMLSNKINDVISELAGKRTKYCKVLNWWRYSNKKELKHERPEN